MTSTKQKPKINEDTPMERIEIPARELCQTAHLLLEYDAEALYENIKGVLDNGNQAVVSLKDIETVTSTFLIHAIGRLFRDRTLAIGLVPQGMPIPDRNCDIFISDVAPSFKKMIARVIFDSKTFYEQMNEAEEV